MGILFKVGLSIFVTGHLGFDRVGFIPGHSMLLGEQVVSSFGIVYTIFNASFLVDVRGGFLLVSFFSCSL